jgi:hypothetical protein
MRHVGGNLRLPLANTCSIPGKMKGPRGERHYRLVRHNKAVRNKGYRADRVVVGKQKAN